MLGWMARAAADLPFLEAAQSPSRLKPTLTRCRLPSTAHGCGLWPPLLSSWRTPRQSPEASDVTLKAAPWRTAPSQQHSFTFRTSDVQARRPSLAAISWLTFYLRSLVAGLWRFAMKERGRALGRCAVLVFAMHLVGCGGGGSAVPVEAVVPPPAGVAPGPAAPYPAGLSNASITVGSVTREYRVHVPAAVTTAPSAVVLVLHGGGGQGMGVSTLGAHPLSVFRSVAPSAAATQGGRP